MQRVLEELKSTNGIIGVYIFNPKIGILAKEVPLNFNESNLMEIGKIMVKIYSTGNYNFSDITEVAVSYKESIAIIRDVGNNYFIIVLFDNNHNLNMLNMSINLIMNDLRELISEREANAAKEVAETENKDEPEREFWDKMVAEDLLKSGPLSDILKEMQGLLTKIMGPISSVVFNDSLNKWIDMTRKPSFSNIMDLVNILCNEIGDPQMVDNFKESMNPLFNKMEKLEKISEDWDSDTSNNMFIESEEDGVVGDLVSAEELLKSNPMSEVLKEMREALAKIMGPIAPMIFTDSLNKWIKSVQDPSFFNIMELLDILCEEIGDTNMQAEYRELIVPLFKTGVYPHIQNME